MEIQKTSVLIYLRLQNSLKVKQMKINSDSQISLNELETNSIPGISKSAGAYLCEASKTCFDNQSHKSGVKISLESISNTEYEVVWKGKITNQIKRTWSDTQEMTEYGASGIAVLLILKFTKYTIIERSRNRLLVRK